MGHPKHRPAVCRRRGRASRRNLVVRGPTVLAAVALAHGGCVLLVAVSLLHDDVLVVDARFDDLFSGGAMVVLGDSADESEWPMNPPAGTIS